MNFSADGGSSQIRVSTSRECSWTARSDASWVVLTPPPTGQGDGSVQFTVGRYDDPSARSAAITVEDRRLMVSQEGRRCEFRLSTTLVTVDPSGGERTIQVEASSSQCRWTAVAQEPWIVVASGAEGAGNGGVTIRVAAAAGPARAGSVTIAGQVVRVDQGTGCTYALGATTLEFGAAGGRGEIPVTTAPGCTWTAQPSAPWITVLGNPTSSGPGVLGFRVDPTSGPPRSATIAIANLSVNVVQGSGCAHTVNPTSVNAGPGASNGTIQVGAAVGCAWSATSAASWVTIAGGANGSGEGQVQFSIAANVGPARTTSLSVAGHTVTIAQASGCTYSVSPTSQDVGPGPASGSTSIATGAGCPWTSSSNVEWISVATPSGSGPAQVTFSTQANPGPPRSGTFVLVGQVFTVNQSSACTWTFVPPNHVVGAEGGNGNILVIVAGACTWAAVSNAEWITVTSGASGAGGGLVQFVVAPNPGAARTGTLTIAGQRYDVIQAGR